MSRIPQQSSGLDPRTISRRQQITDINVASLLPRLIRDIPELVILSSRNRSDQARQEREAVGRLRSEVDAQGAR